MKQNALRSRLVRILVAASACAVFAGGALAMGEGSTAARAANGGGLAREGFRDAGPAITDAVDPDAVVLPDGRLRMYYGVGVGGSDSWRITSSISTDGQHWTPESTNLRGRSWGPADVVRLPDGRFRMYYTPSDDPELPAGQQRSVRSAISDDGINWTAEEGYRLNPAAFPQLVPPQGVQYQVSHPGVVQLPGGTWLMLASFSIERGFDRHGFSSNDTTELIVWATSPDGLTFTARGIAVDSRNKATFDGYASSPDPVIWPDGTVRAFFWSPGPQRPHPQERYNGILSTTFTGHGWTTPTPVRTSAPFPGAFAAGDGGSDPTSVIFKGRMLLFHGGVDRGPSHDSVDYSVPTSTMYRVNVQRAGRQATITSGIALGASPPRADGSTGMSCAGQTCSARVFAGTHLWLHATPAPGYRLAGWTGCNMTRPAAYPRPLPDVKLCWVNVNRNTTVTARFVRGAAPAAPPLPALSLVLRRHAAFHGGAPCCRPSFH